MFMSNGPSHGPRAIFERYEDADAFLRAKETNRYQFGRQSGWLERLGDGAIGLRYHDTHVMTLHDCGITEFDSGGWMTPSTAAWMHANQRFRVSLYEPRNGERKPFRYSTIRFAGHDRNIERQLREEMNMPTFAECDYISTYAFKEYVPDERDWIITNQDAHDRAEEFQEELARRKVARHSTYVYTDGIRFTQRGRCIEGTLLSEAIRLERDARDALHAEQRRVRGAITRYTNRTMKALAEGLPLADQPPNDRSELRAIVERAEPNAALTVRMVSPLGDVRDWLNFHVQGGEIIIGDLPPVLEHHVRERITRTLKSQLI